ncbi:MAG: S-methyl-5-thioribose-1-phosphate isomerase [Polyangiaceae bacterium]|nr:S-methyl-5-thioribose-1-phosphate isomerase [Polyangiaceae bacterium]
MAGVPHPEPLSKTSYSAAELLPDDSAAVLLEQRKLPETEEYLRVEDAEQMARAIRDMVVRGAPAIGIAAAYGMVLAARRASDFRRDMAAAAETLEAARPTAVNLAWAVRRMLARADAIAERDAVERVAELAALARSIHADDVEANRRMGAIGAERVPDGATVLTHCNAGALATGGYGTALGVIRAAVDAGKRVRVLADETRPYLQGARLTAWELARDGIDVRVITDNSAASFFARGAVDLAVVGSDRIAANGDVANKIGTYGVACLARIHERPFYVAAPWSTVDMDCASGEAIVIEQRPSREVTHVGEQRMVPEGVSVENPSFDVTPARLVVAIFTERGAVDPVGPQALSRLASAG